MRTTSRTPTARTRHAVRHLATAQSSTASSSSHRFRVRTPPDPRQHRRHPDKRRIQPTTCSVITPPHHRKG
eukprot:scaffold37642_cov30-Tisochrysis_lutea.AAC.4